MRRKVNLFNKCCGIFAGVIIALILPCSCEDSYPYDNEEPSWLGESIYDFLSDEGNYTAYLKLIEGLGYKETLSRTGSKTLFPTSDSVFADYFRSRGLVGNSVDLISSLSLPQKRVLFNSTMLNMAYLDKMLANVAVSNDGDESGEGRAMVRVTSASYLDSIVYVPASKLPNTSYWESLRAEGGAFLVDNTSRPNLFFTPAFMQKLGMTEADWDIVSEGKPYEASGFYVNGVRVAAENKNVICKNGYLHLADEPVVPLGNMAEVITSDQELQLFAGLMDKFSAPYYNRDIELQVKDFYPEMFVGDSIIYTKRYFNDNGTGACTMTPDEKNVPASGMLYFDPAYNQLALPIDIGMMLVPTDEAMKDYWNSEHGKFLRSVYAEWDSVPTDVLSKFIKNHQLKSFVSALPHEWHNLPDQKGFLLNLTTDDIEDVQMACNGIVYKTNRVFPPIDYQCAYAPILTSPYTKVMKTAIDDNDELKFHLYLRSLENQYNLLIPVDEAMKTYREPISWAIWANGGVDKREIWSFKVVGDRVLADVYSVNEDGTQGEYVQTIGAESSGHAKIMNRLNDIIDMHIVVADNASEPLSGFMDSGEMEYALTKSGTILSVSGEGEAMLVRGGGDDELSLPSTSVVDNGIYITKNSHTYFVDRILQDPFASVYSTLENGSEYDEFFTLLLGEPTVYAYFQEDKDVTPIFDQGTTEQSSGVGQIVTSFNNYRYTVIVPTNDAVKRAFRDDPNLWSWARIADEEDPVIKKEKCLYLLNFLRYHFIDGIVPVAGNTFSKEYETAARDKNNRFVRMSVESSLSGVVFGQKSNVIKETGCYNILARDYIVDNKDVVKATNILASSRAVIHLVDEALNYQKAE